VSTDSVDPRTLEDDPRAWAARRLAEAEQNFCERRTEAELVEAIPAEEARRGYPLTPRESLAFTAAFFAPEYRCDLRRLMAAGVEEPEDEE
jgi:hypothetical protein